MAAGSDASAASSKQRKSNAAGQQENGLRDSTKPAKDRAQRPPLEGIPLNEMQREENVPEETQPVATGATLSGAGGPQNMTFDPVMMSQMMAMATAMVTQFSKAGSRKRKREHELSDDDDDEGSDTNTLPYSQQDADEAEDFDNADDPDQDDQEDPLDSIRDIMDNKAPASSLSEPNPFDKAIDEFEEFFRGEEQRGPPLYPKLAGSVHKSLRLRPFDEKLKVAAGKYNIPDNIQNLKVPKTNQDVSAVLHKGPRYLDMLLQKAGMYLSKGLIPILTILSDKAADIDKPVIAYKEQLHDALSLMTATITYINQARKDNIRNDINNYQLAKLCTWDTAVGTDELFPFDVSKKVDEMKKVKRLDSSYNFSLSRQRGKNSQYQSYQSGPKKHYTGHKKSFNKNSKPFLGHKKKFNNNNNNKDKN